MRVLFLDFDGVLHPATLPDESRHFEWLASLRDALQGHRDVGVVVHSTWRYAYGEAELRALLSPLRVRVLGTVPRGERYGAILWWLHMNSGVTSYRILDDNPREFPDPAPAELVVCNPDRGVSSPDVLRQLDAWLKATHKN